MATPRSKPACDDVMRWLKNNLGNLGALTGTDARALRAAAHILELYAYEHDDSILSAFATVVMRMQPSTREFAYHVIAFYWDWPDRARVWVKAGLPDADAGTRRCKGEGWAAA